MYLIAWRRQFGPGALAGGRGLPAGHGFVDRLDAGLLVHAGGEAIDPLAVEVIADADFQLGQRIEDVELGQRDAVDAGDTLTTWRVSTASNQPQRRGRPVLVPNSLPRVPIRLWVCVRLAVSAEQFGWERAGADARRVGLGEAEDVADVLGADAGAGRGLRADRVRRCHDTDRCRGRCRAARLARPRTGCACPARRALSSVSQTVST